MPRGARGAIEAVLMVVEEPVSEIALAAALGVPQARVEILLEEFLTICGLRRGECSNLLHQGHQVELRPVLRNPSIRDAAEVDTGNCYRPAQSEPSRAVSHRAQPSRTATAYLPGTKTRCPPPSEPIAVA